MKFAKLVRQLTAGKKPLLAVLVDPDKFNKELIILSKRLNVSCFLVGGSRLLKGDLKQTVKKIKSLSTLPVVLFPGDETQLSKDADGLLLLSLLSGNNADYLIGKHVLAAPTIKKMNIPLLSTAYLLINDGELSSTQKVTNTRALNPKNTKRILHHAIAAEQLGFKAVYLEAGSGAKKSLSGQLIKRVKAQIKLPVIVGGGIDSTKKVSAAINAGANMVVIGNALEKNVNLLLEISKCFDKKVLKGH